MSLINKKLNVLQKYTSGQKKVFKVIDDDTQKIYMKKEIFFENLGDADRFYQEINILESIDSIFYPKIYEKTINFDKKKLIILEEFIEGETLREKIKKSEYKNDEKKCIHFFYHLIEGLSILWKKNIVHRDLKPENIIVKPDGKPVILDLGIAKCLYEKNLTVTNFRMPYSNNYFSPEQYRNESHLISQRTDFFVLGIVLGEMFTGKHLFSNEKDTIANNILKSEPLLTKSNNMNILLKKLLAKKQYNRFRNENIIKKYLEKGWDI